MHANIVIMGPICVGKSTVAAALAQRLGALRVELDEERARLYRETDFSPEELERRYAQEGIMGWWAYQKPYELLSVKKILQECRGAVIDFGGGQSVYEDEAQAAEFLRLMAPVKNSFLLMPYEDEDQSIAFLKTRLTHPGEAELNEVFVRAQTSRQAARHILYTGTKTAEEIVEEILPLLQDA